MIGHKILTIGFILLFSGLALAFIGMVCTLYAEGDRRLSIEVAIIALIIFIVGGYLLNTHAPIGQLWK